MNKHGKQKGKYAAGRFKGTTITSQSYIKLTNYIGCAIHRMPKQLRSR